VNGHAADSSLPRVLPATDFEQKAPNLLISCQSCHPDNTLPLASKACLVECHPSSFRRRRLLRQKRRRARRSLLLLRRHENSRVPSPGSHGTAQAKRQHRRLCHRLRGGVRTLRLQPLKAMRTSQRAKLKAMEHSRRTTERVSIVSATASSSFG